MSDVMGFFIMCAVLLVGWEVNSIKRILQQGQQEQVREDMRKRFEQAAGGSAAAKGVKLK